MTEKQELIKQMIQMQHQFSELERKSGVSAEEYYDAEEGHPLSGYSESFSKLANRVVDLAHEEKKSSR